MENNSNNQTGFSSSKAEKFFLKKFLIRFSSFLKREKIIDYQLREIEDKIKQEKLKKFIAKQK